LQGKKRKKHLEKQIVMAGTVLYRIPFVDCRVRGQGAGSGFFGKQLDMTWKLPI
jgi:hypothetical protein